MKPWCIFSAGDGLVEHRYQEAVVASHVQVFWGYLSLPLDVLACFIFSVYHLVKTENDCLCKEMKKTKGLDTLRAIWNHRNQHHQEVGQPNFLHLLWRTRRYLEATDKRDMVYSLLAFQEFPKQQMLKADYNISVEEAYTDLTSTIIKITGSLDVSQCVVPTERSSEKVPSWVPNWSE